MAGIEQFATGALYYGDNLDILRRYIPDESVDLIYLDPPFNSSADYNVIFRDETGRHSDGQMTAFDDTWHWGPDAERQYLFLTNSAYHQGAVSAPVSALVGAFHAGIRPSPMLAYLVEMAVRLVEMRRTMKRTGSLYLHCDSTASHYLKLILDAIFGADQFRNEIIWQRTGAHNDAKRWGRITDSILFYTKSDTFTFHPQFAEYDPAYVAERYRYDDGDGRKFWPNTMTAPAHGRPVASMTFRGQVMAPPTGTMWRFTQAEIDRLEAAGRIYYSAKGKPYVKSYLDERLGRPAQNLWTDIAMPKSLARHTSKSPSERLGYPTQKPLALLERIIAASSNPGDVVLDPFCGCGTAVIAAQKLGRQWAGIDITYLAIAVMKARLRDSFPGLGDVEVVNRPTEVAGARAMLDGSLESKYQFQWWALDLVGASPRGDQKKKGADAGIDGVITFTGAGGKLDTCIVSVKSGGVGRAADQAVKGDMASPGAAMGLVVGRDEPTAGMKAEAAAAGVYYSEVSGKDYPAIQLLTIRELLEEGRRPQLPLLILPAYQRAERVRARAAEQTALFGTERGAAARCFKLRHYPPAGTIERSAGGHGTTTGRGSMTTQGKPHHAVGPQARVSPTAPESKSASANVWGLLESAPGFATGMERARQDFAEGRVRPHQHRAPKPTR